MLTVPSYRNLIRKIMFVFQLPPPPQPLGLTLLGNGLFLFSICLGASAFETHRESSCRWVLEVAERMYLELAWSSLPFPQSSWGPPRSGVGSPPCRAGPCLFSWVGSRARVECSHSAVGRLILPCGFRQHPGVTHACPSPHLCPCSHSFPAVHWRFENLRCLLRRNPAWSFASCQVRGSQS